MKNNFIKILPDSVQLYGNWLDDSNQYDVIKSFKKGGLTYTIVNDNIKFYAYNDYFYKNCIMSYDLPVTINDATYSSIDEITTALNDIYPDDNNSGEGGGSIDVDVDDHLSTLSTNPVQNKVVTQVLNGKADKSEIPSLGGYATENWVEGQGYLKEHQDLSEYAKKNEVPTLPQFRTINGQKITGDTTNIVIEGGGGGETITVDSELSTTSTNPLQNKAITNALSNKANLSDIPSLNGYATENWVLNKKYLTQHQDLSDYATKADLNKKQDVLVSGQNIKTINGQDIFGSGDITIESDGVKKWEGTRAEYNALGTYDENTLYIITDENVEYAKKTDIPSLTGYATQTWVEEQGYLKEEQDKLSAGTGIKIENNVVSAKIWQGTKAEYNAITTKDSDTIYLIYEE